MSLTWAARSMLTASACMWHAGLVEPSFCHSVCEARGSSRFSRPPHTM